MQRSSPILRFCQFYQSATKYPDFVLTGLGNANDIDVLQDGGQDIRLDRRRNRVSTQLDIVEHDGM